MAQLERMLAKHSQDQPEKEYSVVITLAETAQDVKGEDLGLVGTRELMPGILSGTLTGAQLLELQGREEIAEIVEDSEVGLF
jgi:hypothetical protein